MKPSLTSVDCCCWSLVLLSLAQAIPVNRAPESGEAQPAEAVNPNSIDHNKVCSYENVLYSEGQNFTTSNPCETCICRPPGFACTLRSCDMKPGCKAMHTASKCCPEYLCECEINGRMYGNGEKVEEPNPCKVCYCKGGEIKCAVVTCYTRNDCEPRYTSGKCCPKYDHCPPLETLKNKTTTLKPALVVISDLTTESESFKPDNGTGSVEEEDVTEWLNDQTTGLTDCSDQEIATAESEFGSDSRTTPFQSVATLEIIEIHPGNGGQGTLWLHSTESTPNLVTKETSTKEQWNVTTEKLSAGEKASTVTTTSTSEADQETEKKILLPESPIPISAQESTTALLEEVATTASLASTTEQDERTTNSSSFVIEDKALTPLANNNLNLAKMRNESEEEAIVIKSKTQITTDIIGGNTTEEISEPVERMAFDATEIMQESTATDMSATSTQSTIISGDSTERMAEIVQQMATTSPTGMSIASIQTIMTSTDLEESTITENPLSITTSTSELNSHTVVEKEMLKDFSKRTFQDDVSETSTSTSITTDLETTLVVMEYVKATTTDPSFREEPETTINMLDAIALAETTTGTIEIEESSSYDSESNEKSSRELATEDADSKHKSGTPEKLVTHATEPVEVFTTAPIRVDDYTETATEVKKEKLQQETSTEYFTSTMDTTTALPLVKNVHQRGEISDELKRSLEKIEDWSQSTDANETFSSEHTTTEIQLENFQKSNSTIFDNVNEIATDIAERIMNNEELNSTSWYNTTELTFDADAVDRLVAEDLNSTTSDNATIVLDTTTIESNLREYSSVIPEKIMADNAEAITTSWDDTTATTSEASAGTDNENVNSTSWYNMTDSAAKIVDDPEEMTSTISENTTDAILDAPARQAEGVIVVLETTEANGTSLPESNSVKTSDSVTAPVRGVGEDSSAPIVVMISADQIQFLKVGEEPPMYVDNSQAAVPDKTNKDSPHEIVIVPRTTPMTVEMVKVVNGVIENQTSSTPEADLSSTVNSSAKTDLTTATEESTKEISSTTSPQYEDDRGR